LGLQVIAFIRVFVRLNALNASTVEFGPPSKQKCHSGGVIEQLTVIDRTSNSSSSLPSAPVRVVIADRGFPSFFGRMEERGNATQFCQNMRRLSPRHGRV
jgi:hypothetical protein